MSKTQYQERLEKISELQDKAENLITKLNNAMDSIKTANQSSATLRSEVSALNSAKINANAQISAIDNFHARLTSIKTQIDTQLSKAESGNSEIANNIESYETKFNELASRVSELIQRSNGLMKDTEETLKIATSEVLSGDFAKRVEKTATSRRWWAGLTIGYSILAAGALVWLVFEREMTASDLWGARSIVLIPLIYLFFFLIRQFNRTRDLEEKYTFKLLVSKTLQNNIKLLENEFKELSREQRLDFTIKTMEKIYDDPVRQSFISGWFETSIAKFGFKETKKEKETE